MAGGAGLFLPRNALTASTVPGNRMDVSWPVICLTFAAGFEILMAVAARSRMRTLAAKPFVLGLLMAAAWAINYALDLSTASFDDKLLLLRLRLTFLPFYALVWFETAYRLAYGRKCLYGWRLALASIIPAITVAFNWFPPPREFLVLQRDYRLDLERHRASAALSSGLGRASSTASPFPSSWPRSPSCSRRPATSGTATPAASSASPIPSAPS